MAETNNEHHAASRWANLVVAIQQGKGAVYWWALLTVAGACYLTDWLGALLAAVAGNINNPILLAMALALGAVWLFGNRVWPGVWLGLVLSNLAVITNSADRWGWSTGPTVAVLVIATTGTLQTILTASVLMVLMGTALLDRARHVFAFAATVFATSMITPTVGVLSLHRGGVLAGGGIASAWQTWWWGTATGFLALTPFLMIWLTPAPTGWSRREKREAAVAMVVLVAGCILVFNTSWLRLWPYTVIPVLLWVAMRLGARGTTAAILLTAGLATWGTVHGVGAFGREMQSPHATLLVLQGFIGVSAVMFLMLTATVGERRRAEEAARQSEEMVRRLIEAAPDAFIVVDERGQIARLNAQAEAMFGYPRDELLGQMLEVLLPARFRDRHVTHRTDYLHQPRMRAMGTGLELFAQRKDGSEFPVDIMLSPLETEAGRLVIAIVRDITDRKRMETDLLHERELLRTLMDNIPDKIYFKDTQSRFVRVNLAKAHLAGGHQPAELLGKTDFDIFTEEHARQAYDDEQEVIRTGQPIIGKEEKETWPDGHETWASTTKLPWRDPAGRIIGTFGISREITGRKVVEEQVGKLHAELERHAQKLEAANNELEAFSYSVSHDLRAPLRAIEGFSRLLMTAQTDQLSEDAQRYLRYIRENADQMGHLIEDLLTFSRLGRQGLRVERVEPAELVRHCLEQLAPDREGRRVTVKVDPLPACEADPAMLKQVYMNLLSNALKFTRTRAEAVIEVGCREDSELTGQRVYFVRDNGVGFDMRYVDKLFGVFQRLHRPEEYEGTGVGLALVQRIIHRHGGRVWATGEVGQGATFSFTLAAKPAEE
jgi:PAS domain S-box-containing protein